MFFFRVFFFASHLNTLLFFRVLAIYAPIITKNVENVQVAFFQVLTMYAPITWKIISSVHKLSPSPYEMRSAPIIRKIIEDIQLVKLAVQKELFRKTLFTLPPPTVGSV